MYSLLYSQLQFGTLIYQRALQLAVSSWAREGINPTVLDIGAGAALLSLCAWKAGAAAIYACEGRLKALSRQCFVF